MQKHSQANKIKWYTQSTWVDLQTGEVLTKHEAEINYRITKKKSIYERKHRWVNRTREEYGVRTIVNECTREGKQRSLWEQNNRS